MVLSVLCSIGAYPLVTTLFERWYTEGFFLAAAFDTFRVYEKSFNKECVVSSLLLQVFIIVLSLLPDYLYVVITFIKTSLTILRYQCRQIQKDAMEGKVPKVSTLAYADEEDAACCSNVSRLFKKRHNVDLAEREGKPKQFHSKSSVMPMEQILERVNLDKHSSKTPYISSNLDKPLEPLNANLLLSDLTLNNANSDAKIELRNVSQLKEISDNDRNLIEVSTSSNPEVRTNTGLTTSIANILFKPDSSDDQTKTNLTSIERNSLSMMVSYHKSYDGHDNPSFEKTTPMREVVEKESVEENFHFTTRL